MVWPIFVCPLAGLDTIAFDTHTDATATMAKITTHPRVTAPPSVGRAMLMSPLTALRFEFLDLPRAIALRLGISLKLLAPLLVLFVIVSVAASVFVYSRKMEDRKGVAIVNEWKSFDVAAARSDSVKMKESLDRIAYAAPDDLRIAPRRRMMITLEADPSDQAMVQYCMMENLRLDKKPEFKREARKRLDFLNGDWRVLCLLANEALQQGDRAGALELMKQLPSPTQADIGPSPGGILLALQLNRNLGLSTDTLREYMLLNILPIAKSNSNLFRSPAIEKFQFFNLYINAFQFTDRLSELKALWVPYSNLARSMLDDPELSTPIFKEFGNLQIAQLNLLNELIAKKEFPAEEVEGLQTELEDRVQRSWLLMRERDPKNPMAYVGPAIVMLRRRNLKEAIISVNEGLKVCGDSPELLAAMSELVRLVDGKLALQIVQEAVARTPKSQSLLALLIANAKACGRPDLALDACTKARAISDDNFWVCREEAAIWLDQRQATRAIAALHPVLSKVHLDGQASRLYVTALCRSKANAEVEKFVGLLAEEAKKPDIWSEALQAGVDGGMANFAIASGEKLTARWPNYLPAWRLLGDAHALLAEPTLDSPVWDASQATLAVRSFEKVLEKEPKNQAVANMIVWLQCKALRQPGLAENRSMALKEAEARGDLKPSRRETLAVMYIDSNRPELGRKILEDIIQVEPNVPSYYIHLGVAYAKLGQRDQALRCLEKAGSMTKATWETVELDMAIQLLKKVN